MKGSRVVVVVVVGTARRHQTCVVVVVEEAAESELEERVVPGGVGRLAARRVAAAAAPGRGRPAALRRHRLGDVEVGRVGGVRDGRDVRRRAPADVVELDAVEVGVPLELGGAAATPQPPTLVAQQARDEVARGRAQVVHVRNVQRRRPVKHLTTQSERKCVDTIGTVLVPWAGHFQY